MAFLYGTYGIYAKCMKNWIWKLQGSKCLEDLWGGQPKKFKLVIKLWRIILVYITLEEKCLFEESKETYSVTTMWGKNASF